MREHGLTDYTFKWDKAVRRFGSCNGRTKVITLSRPMTQHETNERRVINTILHEIAHGLDYRNRGYSNHDSEWKRVARSIGCSGDRCGSSSGVDKSQFMKWVATCIRLGCPYGGWRRTPSAGRSLKNRTCRRVMEWGGTHHQVR